MKLTQKESVVIRLRYGIGIDDHMTYEEIAKVVNLSKTMVKQLEHRAIRKLKHLSNRNKMLEIQEIINLMNTPENW